MVLLLPIGSKIVKENSDCSKDFATRRNEHKRHKSMAGSMIRPERSYRLINSEQVNPFRNQWLRLETERSIELWQNKSKYKLPSDQRDIILNGVKNPAQRAGLFGAFLYSHFF